MSQLLTFCLILFGPNAFATLRHPASFIPAQQELQQLQLPLTTMAATVLLTVPDANGKLNVVAKNGLLNQCSASVVSDAGLLLTAGHCFDACLQKNSALKTENGVSVLDRSALAHVQCPIEINGQSTNAQILASNTCRGENPDQAGTPQAPCDGLDFAVLKIVGPNPVAGINCYRLADQMPPPGTAVLTVGFPLKTFRALLEPGAEDSDGKSEYISPGKTIAFQDFCTLHRDPSTKRDFGHPAQTAVIQHEMDDGNVIQTDGAENFYQMSGGSLVDAKTYELVGVLRSIIDLGAPYEECDGDSFHTATAGILKFLRSDYPNLDLSSTFACTRPIGAK